MIVVFENCGEVVESEVFFVVAFVIILQVGVELRYTPGGRKQKTKN